MIDHITMLYENFLERISPADDRVIQWNMAPQRMREHIALRWFQTRTPELPEIWYKRTVLDKQYPAGAGIKGSSYIKNGIVCSSRGGYENPDPRCKKSSPSSFDERLKQLHSNPKGTAYYPETARQKYEREYRERREREWKSRYGKGILSDRASQAKLDWLKKNQQSKVKIPDVGPRVQCVRAPCPQPKSVNGGYGGVWNMKPFKQYTSMAELNADLNKQGSGLSSAQESIKADKKLKNNREIKKRSRIYI